MNSDNSYRYNELNSITYSSRSGMTSAVLYFRLDLGEASGMPSQDFERSVRDRCDRIADEHCQWAARHGYHILPQVFYDINGREPRSWNLYNAIRCAKANGVKALLVQDVGEISGFEAARGYITDRITEIGCHLVCRDRSDCPTVA